MKRLLSIAAAGLLILGATGAAQAQQYDPNVQLVDNWYRLFLGRPVDQGGVNFYVPLLTSRGPQFTVANILGSEEYYNRNGANLPGMVVGAYRDVLNRTQLTQPQVDYWVNKAAQYGSRETMAQEFLRDANVDVTTLGAAQAAAPLPAQPPAPPAPVYTPNPAPAYTPPVYVAPRRDYPYRSDHHWHRIYNYRPW